MEIIKRGERIAEIGVRRSSGGLIVQCKTTPAIEEFFRSHSEGIKSVATYGYQWAKLNCPMAYTLPTNLTGSRESSVDYMYRLDALGQPLMVGNEDSAQQTINLSMLRCVGSAEGVSFCLNSTPMSKDGVEELVEGLGATLRGFYTEFLLPLDYNICLTTQELRGI